MEAGRERFNGFQLDEKHGLSVVHWMDRSTVQLLATHVAVQPLSTLWRWDWKNQKYVQVPCPAIVHEYNQHMGGVDLFDMLMALYKVDHKSTKWYRCIFFWVLNVTFVNGWLLYKQHCEQYSTPPNEQLNLLKFTCSISQSLVSAHKLPPSLTQKRRDQPGKTEAVEPWTSAQFQEEVTDVSLPRNVRRCTEPLYRTYCYDNVGHLPQHCELKQRCKVCGLDTMCNCSVWNTSALCV